MKFFDSPKLKFALNKILLIFAFYVVAAAAFNGFYVKWTFADLNPSRNNFQAIFAGNADRPFVHRQLMITVAKEINAQLSEKQRQKLIDHLHQHNFISQYYARAVVEPEPRIEYFFVYQMCFLALLASMFVWRRICAEIIGSKLAGTLAALIFALIFLTPIAEFNKESFIFFVTALFPIIAAKVGKVKAIRSASLSIIFGLLFYKYISALYAGAGGGAMEFHLDWHVDSLFALWMNY